MIMHSQMQNACQGRHRIPRVLVRAAHGTGARDGSNRTGRAEVATQQAAGWPRLQTPRARCAPVLERPSAGLTLQTHAGAEGFAAKFGNRLPLLIQARPPC